MSSLPGDSNAQRALRRIGTTLCGRYRITHLIGTGGMAAVYGAVHRNGHVVAIKILHDRLSADPEVERLFRREALLANKINHTGLVPVIDDDVAEDGCIFLVMPLLVGETLRARALRTNNKLSVEEVVVVAHDLLTTLQAAHAAKIVHRDIKPDNLFVARDGSIRVLDFGIARFFEVTESASVTRSGRAMGTPAFMAPEQALGRLRDIDGQTDIWAVGATMFTLLAGRFVHEGESASETLVFAATHKAPRLADLAPSIPSLLCEVVDRALVFDKRMRWSGAESMNTALSDACKSSLGMSPSELPRLLPEVGPSEEVRDATTLLPARFEPQTTGPVASNVQSVGRHLSPSPPRIRGDASRKWKRTAWLGVGIVALALAAIPTTAWLRRAPEPAPGMEAGAQAEPAQNPEILKHLEISHRAWLDANLDRARGEASAALRINQDDAQAHFAFVVAMPLWPDNDARSHFVRAQEGRHHLSKTQVAYIEALAPAMTVPPNFRLSMERLESIHRNMPDDLVIRVGLADMLVRVNELQKARDLLAPLVQASTAPAIVLSDFGAIQSFLHDVEGSRGTLSRCFDNYPGATACAALLSQLEQNEGNCTSAERVLRRTLSVYPDSAPTYLSLAYTLHGLGASPSEVRPLLEHWARLADGPVVERNLLRVEMRMALLEARFQDALKADAKLGKLIAGVDDDEEQFDYTGYSMLLKAEVGQSKEAKNTLDAYIARRHQFLRSSYAGDNVLYLVSIGTRLGLLPWEKWVEQRDARLAVVTDRDGTYDGRARTWLEYFAMPTTTTDAAKEAVDVLPQYPPILDPLERWFWHDDAIGRMYMLVGRYNDAKPYLERAAGSCSALEDLVQHTRALLDFAAFLERTGDPARACSIYDRVLKRWPARSGSVSATFAAQHRRAACGAKVSSSSAR